MVEYWPIMNKASLHYQKITIKKEKIIHLFVGNEKDHKVQMISDQREAWTLNKGINT